MTLPYTGSGPYCYANSLAMVLGEHAPPTGVIECLTGSPFGFELLAGTLPFFDPYGWDPELGLDAAIGSLGWTCERTDGGSPEEAMARLRKACADGPVLTGPLEMGLLTHQPGMNAAIGADHYVVVLAVEDGTVLFHDPHGHPYATLPTDAFNASWRGDEVTYISTPYVMRSGFVRLREVAADDALRRTLPAAVRWLAGRDDLPVPAGTLGGAAGLEALAGLVDAGLDPGMRTMLQVFSIRVGARRLSDAAACLSMLGLPKAAALAATQARIIGGLQHPAVVGDDRSLADGLRRLAPTYNRLRELLTAAR
ncbi:hypothetical protein ACFXJ5_26490 [Streptomyces sp. NPDC059373]